MNLIHRPWTALPTRHVAIAVAALLLTAGCGGGENALGSESDASDASSSEVVIAHQNYTEMQVMAHMYAALLEQAGYAPTLKGVDTRDLYVGPLSSGEVDVVPDYASSMTEFLNREANGAEAAPVASPDVDRTLERLKQLGAEQGIVALEPAQAEDANAFAVTEKFAEDNAVTTLGDLGRTGLPVALAAAPDCPERADCQLGLESVYDITVSSFEPLGFGTPQTKEALTSGEVQLGQVGTSDGSLSSLDLVVLEDDKNWQNAENLTPVANADFLDANPDVADVLNELSAVLTTEDLMELNEQVDAQRELPEAVATGYLEDKGLLE